MESGWLKARIIVTKDDTGKPKMLRDSGIPNDTRVIATIPNNTLSSSSNLEEVWQRCVSSATLMTVEMVESCDLPVPSSPLDSSTGSLSMSNDLSLYMCETISVQYRLKHREQIWIQPMKSHPVGEVWLRPSQDCAEKEEFIQQFLDQVHERSTMSTIIVRLGKMLQFTLSNSSSHDPVRRSDDNGSTELWFDVVHMLPIAQGHLTADSKIIVVPLDVSVSPCHSNSDTDSDEGLTYDPHERIIKQYSGSDDTEDEDSYYAGSHDLKSLSHPRQPLLSASQIRRSSVVTIGNNIHLLKCIPLYDFPVEKNFILLSKHVRERLGCYGLENLLISPVEYPGHHADQGISFVAIIEDHKGIHIPKHTVYVHPEVYFNLFPYPVDHVTTHHQIQAEV